MKQKPIGIQNWLRQIDLRLITMLQSTREKNFRSNKMKLIKKKQMH